MDFFLKRFSSFVCPLMQGWGWTGFSRSFVHFHFFLTSHHRQNRSPLLCWNLQSWSKNMSLHTHILSPSIPSTPPHFIQSLPLCDRSVSSACPDLAGQRRRTVSFLPSCSAPYAEWTRCCLTSLLPLHLVLDQHLPPHLLQPVSAEKGPLGSALLPPWSRKGHFCCVIVDFVAGNLMVD